MRIPSPQRVAAGCLLLAIGLADLVLAADADAPPADDTRVTAAPQRRMLHQLKYRTAESLAETLTEHFQSRVRVRSVPGSSSALLVASPESLAEEVLALIERLDQPVRELTVEIWLVELAPTADQRPAEAGPTDAALHRFKGPAVEVAQQIAEMQMAGEISVLKHLRLQTLEEHPTTVQTGDNRPVIQGETRSATGRTYPQFTRDTFGTLAQLTARLQDDGACRIELMFEDSRQALPAKGAGDGQNAENQNVVFNAKTLSVMKTALLVPPGSAVAAASWEAPADATPIRRVLVVTAGPVAGATRE